MSSETLERLPKIHGTHRLWPKFLAQIALADHSGRGLQPSQTALAFDAAVAGQGVALASQFLVRKDLLAGNLVVLVPSTLRGEGDFYVLTRRDARDRAATTSVLTWMQDFSDPC